MNSDTRAGHFQIKTMLFHPENFGVKGLKAILYTLLPHRKKFRRS